MRSSRDSSCALARLTCRFKGVKSSIAEHEVSVSKPLQKDSEAFPKRMRIDNAWAAIRFRPVSS